MRCPTVRVAVNVQAGAEPLVTEPDKCHEWRWVPFSDIPQPWFSPLRCLLESGFEPSADKSALHVRLSEVVVSESARSGHNPLSKCPPRMEIKSGKPLR